MGAPQPSPEFFRQVPMRPGEQVLGFLPNVLSIAIPIQGGRPLRKEEWKHEMVERPTDLVGTDQRLVGYRSETERTSAFTQSTVFRIRFVAPLENVREIRANGTRLEFMAELAGWGLHTVYVISSRSAETQGLSQWLETICRQRREALGMEMGISTGEIRTGGKTTRIREGQDPLGADYRGP